MRRQLGVAIAAALLCAAGGAHADKKALDKAREAMGELRYEDAGKALDKAIRSGTHGPDEMTEIYLMMGEVQASLGDDEAASDAFQHALAIDGGAELREGLSPKIKEPFAAARKAMKNKPSISLAHRIIKKSPLVIAVVVQEDPLKMLVGARIAYWTDDGGEGPRSVAGSGGERIDLTLVAGASRIVVAGIDKHGNRVVEVGSEAEPLSLDIDSGGAKEEGSSEPGEDPDSGAVSVSKSAGGSGGSFITRWWLWGGVAVVAGGVGIWSGLQARSALTDLDAMRQNSQDYEFSEAKATADRAKSRATVANVAFTVSAATAITAAVFWYLQRDDATESRTAIVPTLAPGEAGVAATLRF